jgi:hypothetical protein
MMTGEDLSLKRPDLAEEGSTADPVGIPQFIRELLYTEHREVRSERDLPWNTLMSQSSDIMMTRDSDINWGEERSSEGLGQEVQSHHSWDLMESKITNEVSKPLNILVYLRPHFGNILLREEIWSLGIISKALQWWKLPVLLNFLYIPPSLLDIQTPDRL